MIIGMRDLHRLSSLATAQHGVISLEQAAELGVDARSIGRLIEAGLAQRLHPRVVALGGPPPTPQRAAHAAVLQVPDSMASHESALMLRGVERVPFRVAVIVGQGRPNHYKDIRVHRFGDLLDHHHGLVDGIPCTTIERAVVDLGSMFSRARLNDLLDRIIIEDRSTTVGAISRVLREVHHQGRRRIGRLSSLLDDRRPGEPAPRSRLEDRADELLSRSTIPSPLKEYPLPSEHDAGFVDRVWTDARLILEIDGRTWHARERAMAKDRARDRAAARSGWQTCRVLDEELDGPSASWVLAELEAIYFRRLDDLSRRAS